MKPTVHCIHSIISSDCPNINFSDMSNICFIVRSFPVFFMERKFEEYYFPTNKMLVCPRHEHSQIEECCIFHSRSSLYKMFRILTTCLILQRCEGPSHSRQKQICSCCARNRVVVHWQVSPFLRRSLHLSSTPERDQSTLHPENLDEWASLSLSVLGCWCPRTQE